MDPAEQLHTGCDVVLAHAPPVARLVIDGPGAEDALVLAGVLVVLGESDDDFRLVDAVEGLGDPAGSSGHCEDWVGQQRDLVQL